MEKALSPPRGFVWPRLPGGLSISGALSLLAVVAVLVVVSVPRLRGLAVEENEVDARSTAQILARVLHSMGEAGPRQVSMRELLRRPELEGLLDDAEILEPGTLLRRRGYLFELTHLCPSLSLPSATPALLGGGNRALRSMPAVRAWPWAVGVTGRSLFLATEGGATLANPNRPFRWQGLEAAGAELGDLAGWRPVH